MPLEALDQNHLPPPKRLKTSTPIPPLDDADLEPENIEGDCVIDNVFPAEVEEPAAVEEYEEQKRRERGTYTSSIYVDAFNFALNTVAKGELYLFSGDEMEVFARYRSLDYEAQHLWGPMRGSWKLWGDAEQGVATYGCFSGKRTHGFGSISYTIRRILRTCRLLVQRW